MDIELKFVDYLKIEKSKRTNGVSFPYVNELIWRNSGNTVSACRLTQSSGTCDSGSTAPADLKVKKPKD